MGTVGGRGRSILAARQKSPTSGSTQGRTSEAGWNPGRHALLPNPALSTLAILLTGTLSLSVFGAATPGGFFGDLPLDQVRWTGAPPEQIEASLPSALGDLHSLAGGLTFEHDGLRARLRAHRSR